MEKIKFKSLKKEILLAASLASFWAYPSFAESPLATQNQKNIEEKAKLLQELTQYEIDGSFLVSQCIDNVNNRAIKEKLGAIKKECEDNIKELSILVRKYGAEVPDYSKDFKGYFMEGYAAMRGAFTDQGALKALHTNLNVALKPFESTLRSSSFPTDVKEIIKKIYENKKRTLHYIESQI